MKRIACLSLAALFVLTLVPTQAQANEPDITTFKVGSYVAGPKPSRKELKNKVILVVYWGITCGPCLKEIPAVTELAEKHGRDKLIVIANQVWSASDKQCKEAWGKRAKNNEVLVVNGGSMEGFTPKSVPTAVLFDHNGDYLAKGHAGALGDAIQKAVDNIPDEDD